MKKANCFLSLLICMIILTGCIRFNTSITIKGNGKMDVNMLFASMDTSSYSDGDSSSSGLTPEQKKQYQDDGWDVQDYSSAGYKGFTLSKKNVDLKDINATMKQTSENTNQSSNFSIKREGLKYVLKWQVYSDSDKGSMSQAAPYIKQASGYMKFTLNLPVKAISSNATNISNDGKTLEWDLLNLGESGSIEATYSLISIPLVIVLAVVAVLLIAAAVMVVILVIKKKKQTN